jgi:hypothetical protein
MAFLPLPMRLQDQLDDFADSAFAAADGRRW